MTVLQNPQQFAYAALTPQQQLQAAIQQQVEATMQTYHQQAEANQQAAEPPPNPAFDKLLAAETRLVDKAIKSNARLKSAFQGHSFDDAYTGKAGKDVQALAYRINESLHTASLQPDGQPMPLDDEATITAAITSGVQQFVTMDAQSSETAVRFAADVAAGNGNQPAGDGEIHPDARSVDMSREGDQPNFQLPDGSNEKAIQDHFRSTVEKAGGSFEVEEPTLLSMSDNFDSSMFKNGFDPSAAGAATEGASNVA